MADRLKNRIRFSTTLDKKTIEILKESFIDYLKDEENKEKRLEKNIEQS